MKAWGDFDEAHWRQQAACRKMDTNVFFPMRGDGVELVEAEVMPKAICDDCPVRTECGDFAVRTRQPDGVWGGMNEAERRSKRRRMQSDARRERSTAA